MPICCRKHNFGSERGFAAAQFEQWMLTAINTISAANVDLLQTTQNFSSECWFAVNNTVLAPSTDSLQTTHFRQRTPVCRRQHNFGSECWFAANNTISTANADSLQTTQNFSSKCWFDANNTIPVVNADSLPTTQFSQWMLIRCEHNFGSEY
jgi:hypothetical protein